MKPTNTSRMRGAIVGFGNMAENGHLPGWLREKRVAIQAVCDPRRERRQRAREILPDVRCYAKTETLLANEAIDFLDVCTTPPYHAEVMTLGLRRGLHVLCEKPFVGSRTELRNVLRLAEKEGRVAFPVHNWKHAPPLARARAWSEQALLGKILFSELHTLRTRPAVGLTPWRGDLENAGGGGILLDHGWHGVYLLLNLHRERPVTVSAWSPPPPARPGGGAEESAHLLLEFPSGTGTLYLTWKSDRRYNSARVYGEKGLLTLEDNRLALHTGTGRPRTATFRHPLSSGSHHPGWFPPVIRDFLDAVRTPDRALRELEEAFLCLEIIRLAYASIRKGGRRLAIPDGPFPRSTRRGGHVGGTNA